MQCGIEKSHELGSGSLGEQRVEKRSRLGGFKRRIGEAYTREVAEDVLEPAVPLWECAIRHLLIWPHLGRLKIDPLAVLGLSSVRRSEPSSPCPGPSAGSCRLSS